MDIPRRGFISKGTVLAAAAAAGAGAVTAPAAAQPLQEIQNQSTVPEGFAADGRPSAVKRIRIINLLDLEEEAGKILPVTDFSYIRSGSGSEWTKQENRDVYDRVQIEPQPLSGTGAVDLSTTIFGQRLSMPIFIPPMGSQGVAHISMEVGTATGAKAMDVLMISSHVSSNSVEQIAEAGNPHRWFQIYFPQDRGYASEIIHRAKAAGNRAIVATVDDQVAYPREQNMRAALSSAAQARRGAPRGTMGPGNASITIKDPVLAVRARAKKVDVTFEDLVWIKKETGLPVIVKGIVSPKVAQAVIAHGLDGVYVSNHGGRALDTMPGTLTALPRIADAVKGKVPIIFDGGVRRGTDVFKALALGADLVGCGRPIFYGLALGGSLGVQSVLEHLRQTLTLTMQLAGTPHVKAITRDYITRPI